MKLALSLIREDGGTQARAELRQETISAYAERLRTGQPLPPVVVFYDGKDYWLADGFHRVTAADEAKLHEIDADVRQGTQRDAILYSFGANASHGLPRSNEDKRRVVEKMLADPEWGTWTQARIAETCVVSREFVSRVLSEMQEKGKPTCDRSQVTGRDGRTYNTTNLGRPVGASMSTTAAPPEPPPPPSQADRRLAGVVRVEKVIEEFQATVLSVLSARGIPGVDALIVRQLTEHQRWLANVLRGLAA